MLATTQTVDPVFARDVREPDVAPTSHALFVVPTGHGDSFKASVRGHTLELADPKDHRLAPTPDDLLVASFASDLAWSARRALRVRGLPDDVSVSATWRATESMPGPADVDLKITVSRLTEAVREALAAAFASSLAARSLAVPVVHISYEGVNP
jgi:uncharacterized OsmC-like protein